MLKTKSVYSRIDRRHDGLRVLVTRFRGRGMAALRYDVWMPNLGPSERLLRNVLSQKVTWAQFSRLYRVELFTDGSVDKKNRTIKNHGQKFSMRLLKALAKRGNVTLMCHCPDDQPHCHRYLLKRILQNAI